MYVVNFVGAELSPEHVQAQYKSKVTCNLLNLLVTTLPEWPGDNATNKLLNGLVKMLINNHFPQKSVKFNMNFRLQFDCIQYRLLKKTGYF